MTSKYSYLIYVFIVSLMTVLVSCNKTSPTFPEPDKFLGGSLQGLYIFPGHPLRYDNYLAVYYTITNTYRETWQDEVDFHGSIEIRSARLPSVKKTFTIGAENLHTGIRFYDPETHTLTLDPGQSITFAVSWDFTQDDNGADMRDLLFEFYTDPTCATFCRAKQEDFVLTGEIFFFDQRAPVQATLVFPVCYMLGSLCFTPLTDPPCIESPDTSWTRCYPFVDYN